ncbi:hypothetical protein C9374_010301 [Naegleria lovaniensis]|uniref:F-box domain-containing protein n=1 Tax=Naegleria lovaniensis TaxID=51637 RepID=A0AA88GC76_NAELO|nr:uncharacterized protein C9374_010301 [Naegleria lovaniensis]KAG2374927.1 hypothetical protein C9374_010301 [Naegleria lovaniensis]
MNHPTSYNTCLETIPIEFHARSFSFDTLTHISSYLTTLDLVRNASLVNKFWNAASTSNMTWSQRFLIELGPPEWFIEKLNQTLRRNRNGAERGSTHEKSYKKAFHNNKQIVIYEDDEWADEFEDCGKYVKLPRKYKSKSLNTTSTTTTSTKNGNSSPNTDDKISMELFKQELESCFGEDQFWMNFYVLVVSMIPLQCANLHHNYGVVQPPIYPKHYGLSAEADELDTDEEEEEETCHDEQLREISRKVCPELDSFIKQDFIQGKKYDWKADDVHSRRLVSLNYVYFSLFLQEMKKRISKAIQLDDSSHQHDTKRKKLLLDALKFDIKTHKLCTILSIFDRHGIILRYFGSDLENTEKLVWKSSKVLEQHKEMMKSYDMLNEESAALLRTPYLLEMETVRVGYEFDHHPISLLKFCYGILCEKEHEIYSGIARSKLVHKHSVASCHEQEIVRDPSKHVAVGPHTTDAFMPFCNYTFVDETYDSFYGRAVCAATVRCGKQAKIAEFVSNKVEGWCPGFWNANFYFYHVARFQCQFNVDMNMIQVLQDQSNIVHDCC